jgi:O-antigen ligase
MPSHFSHQTVVPKKGEVDAPRYELMTQIAFVLAVSLVLARATIGDFSKARGEAVMADAPRTAGAAAGLGLDLLCCVPAILVLARRVMDREYVLRWSWAVVPMGLLAGWSLLSVFWSADQFAALIGGFHWIAATAMLWAAMQLVRSWLRLRIVAAMAYGLLLAYFMFSLFFKLVDVPSNKAFWDEHKAEILKERGLADDPFLAKQFENKVLAGELMGFFTSANTMAAVVVFLLVVSLGLGVQRIVDDRQDSAGIVMLVLAAGLAGWMIFEAKSKTAVVTPIMAIALGGAAWHWREALGRGAKRFYWLGIGAVALAVAAVVGHGMFHHSLPGTSLAFRWNYWVGGMRMFAQHPLLGVGQDNFGLHYLSVRLPQASEEVKDPHNFFVKFLTELGVVGGVLCVAWLGRMGWEMTRPIAPVGIPPAKAGSSQAYTGPRVIWMLVIISGVGLMLNIFCSTDFGADGGYVVNEILRKFSMFAILLIGACLMAVKSLKDPELDWRPAPILLSAILAGLAVFLVHNLIDFSISEAGPLMLFAILAGSVLGVRQPSVAEKTRKTAAAAVTLAACIVLWLVVGGFVWAPTVAAEDAASDAGVALRKNRANEALRLLDLARQRQPLNAEYSYRAAEAKIVGNTVYDPMVPDLLAMAIQGNPLEPRYYLTRARYLLHAPEVEKRREQIRSDFVRAIELNPNEVSLRMEFGDVLAGFKTPADRAEAVRQYEEAIRFNGLLKADEPKRMAAEKVTEVRRKIEELRK